MAETATLPTKKSSPFAKEIKADTIIYRLLSPNVKSRDSRDDTPIYPPYHSFPNVDVILWPFTNEDKSVTYGERQIRYLRGHTSIFVDEQEKDGRVIPDSVLNNQNNRFEIVDGEIRVSVKEKQKIDFLDYCNRNADSPYRTGKVNPIFSRYSEAKSVEQKTERQEQQKDAIEKAFTASEKQIAFHARYLGVPLIDPATNATRTLKAVKSDYTQLAIDNPSKFLETFDDETLKLKFLIESALEDNIINDRLIPGRVVFAGSKEEICELKEGEKTVDALVVLSSTKQGEAVIKKIKESFK